MSSTFISRLEAQAESKTQPIRVGHVAYDPAQRAGLVLDQRGRRENLLPAHQLGLLVHVHDLQCETVLEPRLAQLAHRADGPCGTWRHAGHEQPQHVVRAGKGIGGIAELTQIHALALRGRRSSPTSTRSVLERSPMIFLMGVGSRRTSVGSARIWSPRPSAGFSTRSTTSML